MLNFNLSAGFDSLTARNFHGHVIAFDRERLQELAGAVRLDSHLDYLIHSKVASDSPSSRRLSRRMEQVNPILAPAGDISDNHSTFYQDELGLSILQILAGEDWHAVDTNRMQHSRVLKQSLEILNDHEKLPIGVTELCRQVGTSISTLNRAFTARFDVTPKAYIRARLPLGRAR